MAINFLKGDVTNAPDEAIAHGCNCRGAFGAGVAKAIRDKWPDVRKEYMKKASRGMLGRIQAVQVDDNKFIINMFTQIDYGRAGRFVDYEAIRDCFTELVEWADNAGVDSIAIPRIGAGLAGGDWRIIEKIIREIWSKLDIDLNIYSI